MTEKLPQKQSNSPAKKGLDVEHWDEKERSSPSNRLFNPCACWSLKDGCIVIGIWTVICAGLQMALFAWQTAVVRKERSRSANSRASYYGALTIQDSRYPAYYEQYYQTPEERFYLQLFIIQIIHLITDLFLLGAGVAVVYGIQRRVRLVLWPYFVTVIMNIAANIAYCGVWLSSPPTPSAAARLSTTMSVRDRVPYWAVLTAVAILVSLVNIYAFVVILAGYRHLQRGQLKYRGYFLEHRPESEMGTPKTSMASLSHQNAAKQNTETKIISDGQTFDPALAGIQGGGGSIRKPMDPNLLNMHSQGQPPLAYPGAGAYPYPYGYPQYPSNAGLSPHPMSLTQPSYLPQPQAMDPVPPYRPTAGAMPSNLAGDPVKQQFTELWLNGVQPGTGVDPAPIFVGPPTRSAMGGSQRSTRHKRRHRDGSRASLRSTRSSDRSRRRRRSRHRHDRGSESDTSSSTVTDNNDDMDTRSRTSRTSRTSVRTCDSCRKKLKPDHRSKRSRRHRSANGPGSESSDHDSDTGYSEFTRSRTSAEKRRRSDSESDSETVATSYLEGTRSSARRSTSSRRSQSDNERRRRAQKPGPPGQNTRSAGGSPTKTPGNLSNSNSPATPAKAQFGGYTSAPTSLNEAKNRQPITGAAGGGARILYTPPKHQTNNTTPGGYMSTSSSFSENPTLPMAQNKTAQNLPGKTMTSKNNVQHFGQPQGGQGPPRYTIDSDVTIQYKPQSSSTNTGDSSQNVETNLPKPNWQHPHGGVPLPGMTSATTQSRPTTTTPETANQSTDSSNQTRTYGTTAV